MTSPFDAIREGNRAILARLSMREQELNAREHALNAELKEIENERWNLSADRETIERAEKIQARVLGLAQSGAGSNSITPVVAILDGGQVRARIGPKRYAMLTALRAYGPLSAEDVADRTGLPLQRVRDQLKADFPHHVAVASAGQGGPSQQTWKMTAGGLSLLDRFESYRRAQGKPLPAAGIADDASDSSDASDEDEVQLEAEEAEAGTQNEEAAGTKSGQDAPTASVTETDVYTDISFPEPLTHGSHRREAGGG